MSNQAKIGLVEYATITEALNAITDEQPVTIDVLCDIEDGGIDFGSESNQAVGKNVTVDFHNYTYSLTNPPIGSSGTQTQGFRILKGNTVTLKNGTLKLKEISEEGAAAAFAMLVHSYGDLKLDGFTVDARTTNTYTSRGNIKDCGRWAMEIDAGSTTVTGKSDIIARDNYTAVTVDFWNSKYPEGVSVTFDSAYTGKVVGTVEYGSEDTVITEDNSDKCKMEILSGDFSEATLFIGNWGGTTYAVESPNMAIASNTGITLAAVSDSGFEIKNGKLMTQSEADAIVDPVTPPADDSADTSGGNTSGNGSDDASADNTTDSQTVAAVQPAEGAAYTNAVARAILNRRRMFGF